MACVASFSLSPSLWHSYLNPESTKYDMGLNESTTCLTAKKACSVGFLGPMLIVSFGTF